MKLKERNTDTAIVSKNLKRKIIKNWQLYLLLLIPFLFIFIFKYGPMLGLQIAFRDYHVSGGIWGSEWVGFENFKKLFNTPKFMQVFMNTIKLSGYQILVEPIVTLTFSLLMNAVYSRRFKKTVQMVSYMPHFISTVVMVGIVSQMLDPRIGLFGKVCEMLGAEAVDLWSKPEAFSSIYVWSLIWQNIGWNSVIYIAALSSVDLSLYEAASIDGASRFKQLLHIELPVVMPTFIILLIMKVGSMMNIGHEQVLLMQNSLNLKASEIISTYSYKVSMVDSTDYSYGTAISLFNSVINLVLIVSVNKIAKKVSDVGLW